MSQLTLAGLLSPLLFGILLITAVLKVNSYSSEKQSSILQQVQKHDSPELTDVTEPSDSKGPAANYIKLEKLYIKWNEGLFGSRNHYRRALTEYLASIIGEEILTDYNYVIVSPISKHDKRLECKLFQGRWLKIIGDIDNNNILEVVNFDSKMLKKLWRTKKLFSVHGKIKTFRLVSDRRGYSVILYLNNLRLIGSDSIRKNSKK